MKSLITLLLLVALSGCEFSSGPPTIRVNMAESSEDAAVTVHYENHRVMNADVSITLSNQEEIEQYRKQVDFLSLRLREAHEKVTKEIHEKRSENKMVN